MHYLSGHQRNEVRSIQLLGGKKVHGQVEAHAVRSHSSRHILSSATLRKDNIWSKLPLSIGLEHKW